MPSDKGINIFTIVGRVLGLVPDPPKKGSCDYSVLFLLPLSQNLFVTHFCILRILHLAYCLEMPNFIDSKRYLFSLLIILKSVSAFS